MSEMSLQPHNGENGSAHYMRFKVEMAKHQSKEFGAPQRYFTATQAPSDAFKCHSQRKFSSSTEEMIYGLAVF